MVGNPVQPPETDELIKLLLKTQLVSCRRQYTGACLHAEMNIVATGMRTAWQHMKTYFITQCTYERRRVGERY